MLHRNTLIAVCAIFCAIAVGAGLFVANLSKQSGLITQQAANITSLPTSTAAESTPIADEPTSASAPTSAPIAAIEQAEPTATSQPAPTSVAPTEGGVLAATAAPTGDTAIYIEYTVQKGDLLNDIAKKYNVTTKAILAINEISNADSLTIGQVLRIPKV
jgi:peptidoglycan DL-endopeptidase LytF